VNCLDRTWPPAMAPEDRRHAVASLVFARHGESEANLAMVIANGNEGYPLTEIGREQSRTLAATLNSSTIDRVLCSPILRARQTAKIIAAAVQAKLTVDQRLRECQMGDLEGRSDPQAWRAHDFVNSQWRDGLRDRRPGICQGG
jgi:broad specificity phosphatase PhoE